MEAPSAGCRSTSLPAIVITAPGRVSTATRQPSSLLSSVAITRLMMSGGVLGAVGTMMRIGFDESDWAWAVCCVRTQVVSINAAPSRWAEFAVAMTYSPRFLLASCDALMVSAHASRRHDNPSVFHAAKSLFSRCEMLDFTGQNAVLSVKARP